MNTLEDMRMFVRIVEAGSLTKAAEQMQTVKSAMSKRLNELEKRLGVTLLRRTTRKQTLTDVGQSYYYQCVRLIEDIADVEASIQSEHGALSGRIKLAAPLSFGLTHLGAAIRQFNSIHPDIHFDIDFSDRKVDLIQEGFDLAIRIANLQDSGLVARKLSFVKPLLCASAAYLQRYGEPNHPLDLGQGHVKMNYNASPEHWQFQHKQSGEQFTVRVPPVMTTNNGDFLMQAAIEGLGLLSTPDFIVYKAVKAGQLKPILTDYQFGQAIGVYALYPQTRHVSLRVRSFIDFLAQFFGDKPYWAV